MGRPNLTLDEIAEFPIVTYDQDFTGRSHIDQAFARIEERAETMPVEELTDAFLFFLVDILGELKAMKALLEGHADPSEKWREFRETIVRRIAKETSPPPVAGR